MYRGGKANLLITMVPLLISLPRTVGAQTPTFTIANADSGLSYHHFLNSNSRPSREFGVGPAAADYDNDGDVDLFFPQAFEYPDELYRNNGDGTFSEIGALAGVSSLKESRCALWFDFDNDGLLDLFVARDPDAPPGQDPIDADATTAGNYLYRNLGDGTFEDVTSLSGDLAANPNPDGFFRLTLGGVAATDFNDDGFLDVYLTCWACANALYRNNGDGTFSEIAGLAGVVASNSSWAPMFADIDRDGDQDLLLNVDFGPNQLYLNQGNETFVNTASTTGFNSDFNEMGMAMADVDRDGDLDVFSTNIEKPFPNAATLSDYSVLFRNDWDGNSLVFTEIGDSAGVRRTGWGWGCTWIDGTNNTWVDLAVTNGWRNPLYDMDQSCYFVNSGAGTFAEMGTSVGFNQTKLGRGLIALDFDLDGGIDLCETNLNDDAILFRNDTPNLGHWIEINLIGSGPGNQFAVGAEVSVTASGVTQRRLVSAGTSFLSQEPYRQHFGLGSSPTATSISIRWPGGTTETIEDVRGDRVATIRRGVGLLPDLNLDRRFDGRDLEPFAQAMLGMAARPMDLIVADVNGDGTLDSADVAGFVALLLSVD